jgi:hypothetical protein
LSFFEQASWQGYFKPVGLTLNLSFMPTNENPQHQEGPVAKAIEKQTAKLPSDVFLWSALGSMAISATAKIMKKDHLALFVGQWAAPFLLLGLYNKIVKLEGSDSEDHGEEY